MANVGLAFTGEEDPETGTGLKNIVTSAADSFRTIKRRLLIPSRGRLLPSNWPQSGCNRGS